MTLLEGTAMAPSRPAKRVRPVRAVAAITGRPKTKLSRVDSPTVPGAQEILSRTIDPLETMHRASQLSDRQWHAVQHYRSARERVYGQAGGAMDFERPRGGSVPGAPPLQGLLAASEVIRIAKLKLYPVDHTILTAVLGGRHADDPGQSFKQVARIMDRSGFDHRQVASRFKIALNILADEYFGPERRGAGTRKAAYIAPDSRSAIVHDMPVERGRTAHASSSKVDWRR